MASIKLVALVGFLAVCAYAAPNWDQTLIWGTPAQLFDKVLYSEKVDVPKTILTVHERDVKYPPHSTVKAGIITAIKVTDLLRTGKNAYVTVTSGGVGKRQAALHLKSKRGYPIRYLVEFWGRNN